MQRRTVATTLTLCLLSIALLPAPATAHTASAPYVAGVPTAIVTAVGADPLPPLHGPINSSYQIAVSDLLGDNPHYTTYHTAHGIFVVVQALYVDTYSLDIRMGTAGTITLVHE